LLRAGQRELEPQDTRRPRSCPGLSSESWSRRTRGDPGVAPGWAAGAGAAGHVAASELPRVGSGSWSRRTLGGPGAALEGTIRFLPVWPQNWWRWFLLVCPQNRWSGFLVEPQNQGD
jgi:hypothetical protein